MENIRGRTADSASVRIRQENPLDCANWNARLSKHSLFHSAEWARVLQSTYGFTPIYFTAGRGDSLESLLPVMEVNSWLTGRRGVSLPFTDHCEPICSSETSLAHLIREALAYGRERAWNYFEWRGSAAVARMFNGAAHPSLSYFGHSLDLMPDTDRLFAQFKGSVRRAIRKAEKSGLEIEISNSLEATQAYYSLHCRIRRRHGLPPQPFLFFRNIQEQILARDLGIVVSARFQGQVVASAIFFHAGPEAIFKFGASDVDFQHLRVNNLVMWQAIQWHAQNGATSLHFGRTSIANEGLRRFKLGWGTREQQIHYYKFDLRKEAFVTQADDAFGWHGLVFRALPIYLSRWTGSMLYRHVA